MFEITEPFDAVVDNGLIWVNDNATALFDFFRAILDGIFGSIDAVLAAVPYWAFILVVFAAGWLFVGRVFTVAAAAGLWLCEAMGLWADTMITLTLVLSSTLMALFVAIPAGILVGLSAGLNRAGDVVLDFIQTMLAYIYLLPGIALLGYGPATAMCATSLVAMRLTTHGIRMTPAQFRELGHAVGMKPLHALFKIRIPFALRVSSGQGDWARR